MSAMAYTASTSTSLNVSPRDSGNPGKKYLATSDLKEIIGIQDSKKDATLKRQSCQPSDNNPTHLIDPQYLLTSSIKALHLAAESLSYTALPEPADSCEPN